MSAPRTDTAMLPRFAVLAALAVAAAAGIAAAIAPLIVGAGDREGERNGSTADTAAAAQPSSAAQRAPAQARPQAENLAVDPQTFVAQQNTAARAAAAAADEQPLRGPIRQRPDFVSPLEWQALTTVAGAHGDSDEELTRLVNRLRFVKQKERWRNLHDAGADPAQRQALAERLLADIPAQVRSGSLDLADAQRLQLALLGDLIADPDRRLQRFSEEVRRLPSQPPQRSSAPPSTPP
jgi:hypothetical protein